MINNIKPDDINTYSSEEDKEIVFYIEKSDIKTRIVRNDAFLSRLEENYYSYIGDVKDVIRSRSEYERMPDQFPHECGILKTYDLSTNIEDEVFRVCVEYTMLYEWVKQFPLDDWEFVEENEKGIPQVLLGKIIKYLEMKYCPIAFHGVIYLFIENQYYEDRHGKLKKDIIRILKSCGWGDLKKTNPIVDDLVKRGRDGWQKFSNENIFNRIEGLIPVKNGIILMNGEVFLLPNSPAWGYTYCLPVFYDEKADPTFIKKFISDICMENGQRIEEKEQLLYQIPAQSLMQKTANPAYLLNGSGSNGKSTYLRLLGEVAGKSNYSSVPFQQLTTDKFKLAELYGMLFNICADIPKTGVNETGPFKMLTGGDMIMGEKKYGHPFRFINKAVMVFSANELPVIDDGTFAFWRRWNILDFTNKFEEDNDFINNLLTDENKSAFLNLIIEKIRDVRVNGLKVNKKSEEVMEMWKMRSSSAYAFIKTRLKKSPQGFVIKSILWNEYSIFCSENDFTEISKIKFRQQLEKEIPILETFIVKDREREMVVKGISFVDPNELKIKSETNTKQKSLTDGLK